MRASASVGKALRTRSQNTCWDSCVLPCTSREAHDRLLLATCLRTRAHDLSCLVTRTETYPRALRVYSSGPDVVLGLGIGGTGKVLTMAARQDSFLLGTAENCDLHVDYRYHAGMHAQLDRIADTVRVKNISTDKKNDIVCNGEVALREFTMGVGSWFEIGDIRYYALNEEMLMSRPEVLDIIGMRQHNTVDEIMSAAVKDSARPILLIGEPGCDQGRLASLIHKISYRRRHGFLELPEKLPEKSDKPEKAAERARLITGLHRSIEGAAHGTVVAHLYQRGRLDDALTAQLVRPELHLRLVVAVESPSKVPYSFPDLVGRAQEIELPSLRSRADEIPLLLDKWFVVRRSSLRFARLRPGLREDLLSHSWPQNLAELRQTADILSVLGHYRRLWQAVRDPNLTTLTRGRLRAWVNRTNISELELPLIPDS